MKNLKNMENQYVDFSTCRKASKICKICVNSPYHDNFEYLLSNSLHFKIGFSNTFDTFQILGIFHFKVM